MDKSFKAVDRYGAEMEFEIIEPTDILTREADMIYRKAYSEAMKEGILTREKMREIFNKHGVWTKEDDDGFRAMVGKLTDLNFKLEDVSKKGETSECIKIAGEMGQIRLDMLKSFNIQQSAYLQSCEGYAELMRLESLMASCVVIKSNKQRYWKNYKDYVIERDQNDKSNVAVKALACRNMMYEQDRDDIINAYPEQRWLKEKHSEIVEKAKEEAQKVLLERLTALKEVQSANQVPSETTPNSVSDQGAAS
jgi:hypothetical protein